MQIAASRSGSSKVEVPMAPMIDIVFQLLIFFMLNLKILAPEGDFNVNLPVNPTPGRPADIAPPQLKVGLRSDALGHLTQLTLGDRNLGNDDAAFERLNQEILQIIGGPGNPLAKDIEVELDADFETQHQYIVKAISRCTGRFDPQTQQTTRYAERIKFAPPRKPKV
jgi:biopolymer transport protein ExbD